MTNPSLAERLLHECKLRKAHEAEQSLSAGIALFMRHHADTVTQLRKELGSWRRVAQFLASMGLAVPSGKPVSPDWLRIAWHREMKRRKGVQLTQSPQPALVSRPPIKSNPPSPRALPTKGLAHLATKGTSK